MYILKSIPKNRVWGTERLKEYSTEPVEGKIGSVYTAAGISDIDSVTEEGDTISHLVKENPERFGLLEGEVFPLIISLTAADKDLSLQVHPTDYYAQSREGLPYGKSEAWFFITPPLEESIIAGQKAETEMLFQESVRKKNYNELLGRQNVEIEDIVYIPSGTIHALTKGALVYEIQQSTDITYRFYDYDRLDLNGEKRELHTKKALETVEIQQNVLKKSFEINSVLDVKEFVVKRTRIERDYRNTESIAQVITLLKDDTLINQKKVLKGQSVLVLPNEIIFVEDCVECMIATPKTYWRETS